MYRNRGVDSTLSRVRRGAPNARGMRAGSAGLVRAMRPKQWVKNALLLAAPALAGTLFHPQVLDDVALGVACFILASSAVYLANDVNDAPADRLHPTKRRRPIASGVVSPTTALVTAALLAGAALIISVLLLPIPFTSVLVAYLLITIAYQLGVKDIPIWELGVVAAGFVLRLIAGGAATGTPLSSWFLIVGGGASFYVVVTKRRGEMLELGDQAGTHRASLSSYGTDQLLAAQAAALAVTTTAYSLWAFNYTPTTEPSGWLEVSVVPLFLGMLRFAQQAQHTGVSAPEDIIFRDQQLITFGAIWLVLVAVGVNA